jgi:hypothetical protein
MSIMMRDHVGRRRRRSNPSPIREKHTLQFHDFVLLRNGYQLRAKLDAELFVMRGWTSVIGGNRDRNRTDCWIRVCRETLVSESDEQRGFSHSGVACGVPTRGRVKTIIGEQI